MKFQRIFGRDGKESTFWNYKNYAEQPPKESSCETIAIGDVVLVHEESRPRGFGKLACIHWRFINAVRLWMITNPIQTMAHSQWLKPTLMIRMMVINQISLLHKYLLVDRNEKLIVMQERQYEFKVRTCNNLDLTDANLNCYVVFISCNIYCL